MAAVFHEFKSLLASRRLAAETLTFQEPPLEERQKLIRRVLENVVRLETMVSNILHTLRLEEGRIHLVPERIYLIAAVRPVLEEV